MGRRGKKQTRKSRKSFSAVAESNNRAEECSWKAVVPVEKPAGLKIVLQKIDQESSVEGCRWNGMSTIWNKDFSFLSPQLNLRRIDSAIPIAEQKFQLLTIDNSEEGKSLRQFYSSCSSTSVINRSDVEETVTTQSIFSSTSVVKDRSHVRRRSRNVLKDVKNTSLLSPAISQEIKRNMFLDSILPTLEGQENVPVASKYAAEVVVYPEVCVRLTQLNEDLFRRHFIETTSTFNSIEENIRSRFQSFTARGVKNDEFGKGTAEVILKRFTPTKNAIKLDQLTNPEPVKQPMKRNRKRKCQLKSTTRSRCRESNEITNIRRTTRSSSAASRQKAADHFSAQCNQSSKQMNQCETVPSSEILPIDFDHRIKNGNILSTKIFRNEASLKFHGRSYENQENNLSDFAKLSNGLKRTEVRLNISSTKTVPEDNSQLDEFLEFRYSAVQGEKSQTAEQQSFSYIGKRKWTEKNSSAECSVPRKRPFCPSNCNKMKPSTNGVNQCVVYMERTKTTHKSANSNTRSHQSIKSIDTTHQFTHQKDLITSSSTYITRNKAAKNKESIQFYRIPWKKMKGIEVLTEKPKTKNEDLDEKPKTRIENLNQKPKTRTEDSNKKVRSKIENVNKEPRGRIDDLNEMPVTMNSREECYSVKSRLKRNAKATNKSIKTEPANLSFCYSTRQKTARNDSVEFYRLPWKKVTGFEVVENKAKKLASKDICESEPDFKGWDTSQLQKRTLNVFPTSNGSEAEKLSTKKGILKRNETLASSTPFPDSSRRRKRIASNVSFINGSTVDEDIDEYAPSPVKRFQKSNFASPCPSEFPMKSCTVLLPHLSENNVRSSTTRSRRRMTKHEARQRAESFNSTKKAVENESKLDWSSSDSSSKNRLRRRLKRSARLRNNKRINYCYSSHSSFSSSEKEQSILVSRKFGTPYVRLNRLNQNDISSYKITPLKEDRIPKKSKTEDDYGIDDINTDDSTDDEEFPKKCIPQWVKDYKNQPRCQSYLNPDLIFDWMRPPKFQHTLRTVFFSHRSHAYM